MELLTHCLTLSEFPQPFLTNPSKLNLEFTVPKDNSYTDHRTLSLIIFDGRIV
jgi:hypothetical protein